MIKHIWFDFSDTIATVNKEEHDRMRYETYARIVKKEVTPELIAEYKNLYEKYNHSNSAVFKSLGMIASFWSGMVSTTNSKTFYSLNDPNIPKVFEELNKVIPISIFSNINLGKILPALGVEQRLFKNLLSSASIGHPKPELDGFYKMIELSNLPAEEILYIGDDLGKDVIPAKTVGIKSGSVLKEIKEADYFFKNFQDILEFVKSKNI